MMNDDKKQKQYLKMTQTPMVKLILAVSMPTVVSMLVTAIYNMTDTFFVSRLGTSASAAVGVVFPMMSIIQAIGFMLGNGSGSRISLFLGQEKNEEADIVASSGLFISVVSGILIAFIFYLILPQLLRLMGATETILPYAYDYAKYIIMGFPVIMASYLLNHLLRGQGKTTLSMVGLATGGFINMILDPVFIYYFGMGTSGAAIATILSQIISFVILLVFVTGGNSVLKLSPSFISREFKLYLMIISLGVPSLLRQGLGSISISLLNNRAAVFGDEAVAAFSIVGRVSMLIMSVMLGVGQGFQPVAGYNYGAKLYKRVRNAFLVTLSIGSGLMILVAAGCFMFAPDIMAAFRPDDPEVIRIGTFTMRLQAVVLPLLSFTICTNMLHQSLGKSKEATLLAITRQGIYFIPLILILPSVLGLFGVQISQSIADVLSLLTAIPFAVRFFKNMSLMEKSLDQERFEKTV